MSTNSPSDRLFELSLLMCDVFELADGIEQFCKACATQLERTGAAVLAPEPHPEPTHYLKAQGLLRDDLLDILNTLIQPGTLPRLLRNGKIIGHLELRATAPQISEIQFDLFMTDKNRIFVLAGKPVSFTAGFASNFLRLLSSFDAAIRHKDESTTLRQLAQRQTLAVKAGQIGIWELLLDTNELLWNEQMYHLYETGRADFEGHYRDFKRLVHPEDFEALMLQILNYLAEERDDVIELHFRIITGRGNIKKIAGSGIQVREPGSGRRMIGINYDMTELETARTQSLYRSRLENLLINLSIKVIQARGTELDQVTTEALGDVGRFVGADRAYRFCYDFDAGTTSNTHEWCNDGIDPEIQNLQNIPTDAIPFWVSSHKKGLPFYRTRINELDPGHALRQILEPQGIKSIVTLPLMDDEHCTGFIGFDSVKQERHWNDVDLKLLKLLSDLLVNAELKRKREQDIHEAQTALQSSLEHAEKLARQAGIANDAKSRFVARVSHEVRTPLHAILGMADSALRENPHPKLFSQIQTIRDAGGILLELINDILEFSKAESHELTVQSTSFDLNDALNKLMQMFAPMARQKHTKLKLEIMDELPDTFFGDPLAIRQVLHNLVSNAVKFTQAGEVTVSVVVKHISETNKKVVFSVTDTGIGIAPAHITKIFDPFFQSDDSDSRAFQGTGLGLTIARMLAMRMHGDICVESQPNERTCFTFMLPLIAAARAHSVSPPPGSLSISALTSLNILLAEDNPVNQLLVSTFLKDSGCQLHIANNGQQVLDACVENEYQVILMDCQMPVLDGFKTASLLRSKQRDGRNPIIIAVTASAMESDKELCLLSGMNDILTKPFSRDELIETISRNIQSNQ